MPTNPYPDKPTHAQPTEVIPGERMEDLQPRQVQAHAPTATDAEPEVENAETRQEEARTVRYAIGKLNDFLQWFIVVLEVTLFLRFFLKLIGADPLNLFAGFLFSLTDIVLYPFAGIVPAYRTFEWPTLIAMGIYWLVFWAIRRFLSILISTPEEATA